MNDLTNELQKHGIKKIGIKKILIYLSSIATIAGGILHFVMIGPILKPENFPLNLLPYTDALFLISGIMQIFFAIPILENWKIRWHTFGICWTFLLTALLILTRVPNVITGSALIDHNHIAFLTEMFQIMYIIIIAAFIVEIRIRENTIHFQ